MVDVLLIIFIAVYLIALFMFLNNYNKYKRIPSRNNTIGYDSALKVKEKYNLDNYIIEKKGSFTDNYNKKVIKLSSIVFHESSLYSEAIGYYIAMQAVLDKENNALFRVQKMLEPFYYFMMSIAYFELLLLAFTSFNILYLVVTLGLCILYGFLCLNNSLVIIDRLKKEFIGDNNELKKAIEWLYLFDITLGLLYLRVLIDNLVDMIKKR